MSNLEEHLLDQLYEQRGNPVLRGRGVGGVAIRPDTFWRLSSQTKDLYTAVDPLNKTLHGYDVLLTFNVEREELRVVPQGELFYLQGPHGHPAVWPSPSITDVQGTHHLQECPMDLADDEAYAVDGPVQGARVKMREGQQRFEYREVTSAKMVAASFEQMTYQDPRFGTYDYEKEHGAPIISLANKWWKHS
jgi:hypothetical protein